MFQLHFSKDTVVERESTFGSPTRIAQVFPLIPKEHVVPYIQRSVQDVSQKKSHLSVNDRPIRAHSVELLQPGNNEEIRRTSFDVPRGTGRQLPSTEGLEVLHLRTASKHLWFLPFLYGIKHCGKIR
ncbi:hypothetical protein GCK32_019905 [Trichostrongylus colubriformis]|uniref:Uncharacterized protein n=1 Tax=Trichostrongylus colubriformis TaxID=6319 RepID=A0AAN8EZN0_TRICO